MATRRAKRPASRKRKPSNRTSNSVIRIAVVSDVHAYDELEPDDAPSHCRVGENDPMKNPLAGLRGFIAEQQLRADILMCPGDLGDKAHPVAIQHVWSELQEIKTLLKAQQLLTTTGNHDLDSRYSHHFDAKGTLQSLVPQYPFLDEHANDKYWARNYVCITEPGYRIIVLNSSAFHGEGNYEKTKRYEYEQGRVSDFTLGLIRSELQSSRSPPINILLCHHHPHPHSELRLGEKDLMIGGQALLEMLGSGQFGSWLVIHGHKHHPKLEYAAGGTSAPIVFAAGSVAAVLYPEIQTICRNQFYIIEFPTKAMSTLGFVARFFSWDWLSGMGWRKAAKASKLPATGGFGWRGDIITLAKVVASLVKNKSSVMWSDLVVDHPSLEFLLPQDIEHLVQILKANHSIVSQPDGDCPPTVVGKVR
ncbi:MAG: metallophosphoesterase [Pirellulales bacterium]